MALAMSPGCWAQAAMARSAPERELAAAPQSSAAAMPQPAPAAAPSSALPRDPFEAAPLGPLLRDDVAGARQIPGYRPHGLDLGGIHFAPSVTLSTDATSNLFARTQGGRGDLSATVAPAVLAVGEAGTMRFVIDARGALARYARLTAYNADTFALRAQGALPVSGLTLALSGGAARRLEPSYEAAGADAFEGGAVLVDQAQAGFGARAELGRTRLTGSIDLLRSHYLPVLGPSGANLAQGFRDERAVTLSFRADRSLGGGRVAFAQGAWRQVRSLHPGSLTGTAPDRTAHAGEALVGLRGEFSNLVMGEVALGYQWRDYRSPDLRDYRALAWRARVEWYATPLVSLALTSRRDVVNSPLPGAAGVVVDTVGLKAFYEARRNLVMVLSATRTTERYRDLPGPVPTLRSSAIGLEATYSANRHVQLGLSARWRERRSDTVSLPRQGHAVEGGLSLRFSL